MATTQIYINTDVNYDYTGAALKQEINNLSNQYPNSNITIFDESNLSYMENASNLFNRTKFRNIDLYNAKFDKCLNMYFMFAQCTNLVTISNFNTSNVIDMGCAFYHCNRLTTVPNFNTSNVTSMTLTFLDCTDLATVPNFNTSNVTSMYGAFMGCHNLTNIPNFNTSNVTSMYGAFDSCTNLTSVPNFNTSKAIYMDRIFINCYNLTSVPNFNTSNVTSMYDMFFMCNKLSDVPNFDTSNVTNMSCMFFGCSNLTTIPNFNTSNVTNMSAMFGICSNLTSILNFDTSNVINMSEMFSYCNNLVMIPNFDTSKVRNMANMFSKAKVNLNYNLNCSMVNNIKTMFGDSDSWSGIALIDNLGALDNLGAGFDKTTNNAYHRLDLYAAGTSSILNRALSNLANLTALGKPTQQIIVQSEPYYGMNSTLKSEITNKGWSIVAAGNVCLTGDMKIKTKNGYKQIKDIVIGDEIYSFDYHTNIHTLEKVTKTINHNNLQIYEIKTNTSTIKCTAMHEILVKDNNNKVYKKVRDIDKTDILICIDKELPITEINIYDNEQLVYEINTENNNNYLVEYDNIIVKQEIID